MNTKQYTLYKDTYKENKMIPIKQSRMVGFGDGEENGNGKEE